MGKQKEAGGFRSFVGGGFGGVCCVTSGQPFDTIKVATCLLFKIQMIRIEFFRSFWKAQYYRIKWMLLILLLLIFVLQVRMQNQTGGALCKGTTDCVVKTVRNEASSLLLVLSWDSWPIFQWLQCVVCTQYQCPILQTAERILSRKCGAVAGEEVD